MGNTVQLSRRLMAAVVAAGVVHAAPAAAGVVGSVFGGKIGCVVDASTVQFCEGDVTKRVETWDGVPIDINITLPPTSFDAPYPLIIELHGWSLGKTAGPSIDRALAGYAVINYSARGFHESCGSLASRATDLTLSDPDACTDRGWTHLGDTRYEGRDSQYLAGLLVDEGLVIPDRVGATGASYGGGRSMILAALKNRLMLPDGSLIAWKSPGGIDMEIAAAAPLIPWSDLTYSLVPNGATLDYRTDNPYGSRAGVAKQQWNATLFASGLATGFYSAPGVDPIADLISFNTRILAGEPYDADPLTEFIIDQFTNYHSAYYIDDSVAPAPLFIYNAWTDDLFPASEALRMWRKVHDTHPGAEVALHFADAFGHPRAGLGGDIVRVSTRVDEFLDFHLQGIGSTVPALEVYTQPCGDAAEVGPLTAADWDAIHPGEVVFGDAAAQSIDEASGDPVTAAALAPLAGGPCREVSSATDPEAATYLGAEIAGAGYTLVGSPTIIADYSVSGADYAQVAARLWDVAPDGDQALVAHGFFRPRMDNHGPQVFQLPANGWQFLNGHAPKFEAVGRSVSMGSASTGEFTVTITNLEVRLPVIDTPDGTVVTTPAAHVLPPAELDAPPCPPAPESVCRAPGARASKLSVIAGKQPGKEKLVWTWKKGEATTGAEFGVGPAAGGQTLCLWDGDDLLVLASKAPASGECGGAPCWVAKSGGAKHLYVDKALTRTGTKKALLKAGNAGKTGIKLLGAGPGLGLPTLPLGTLPLTVQLLDGEDGCWGATYSAAQKNDTAKLKAISD